MMSPIPPSTSMRMQGPPVTPPETPSLSAYPSGGSEEGAGPQQAGALPRLLMMISKSIDTLARAIPGASEDLEQAKALIRGAVLKAAGGGSGTPAPAGP